MTAPQSAGRLVVQARERYVKQAGALELVSRGNMIYQDGGNKAGIYAADFSLLQERLSSVSGEVFDPSCYDHTNKTVSGADAEYDLDHKFAGEEEYVTSGVKGLPEMDEEEPIVPEQEKTAEAAGEEPVTPEPEEQPEVAEEKEAAFEPGEQPEVTEEEEAVYEPEEQPEISVSGNDCAGSRTQSESEEIAEKIADEEGENL